MGNMRKGQHEADMEFAKRLLDKGAGMTEVKHFTNLDEKDIRKVKERLFEERDDT